MAQLGAGLGKGLSEQIPKEVERYRLSQGLQDLSQSQNLTPEQYMAKAFAIPGMTPAMAEQFGQLARMRARGQNLGGVGEEQQIPKQFPHPIQENPQQGNTPSSVTKSEDVLAIEKGYIPPTQDQKFKEAGKIYNENPARWGGDPERAINYIKEKYAALKDISQAHEKRHENLTNLQNTVKDNLSKYAKGLGVDIPSRSYSDIEENALEAVKNGMTEEAAMRKYGKELDEISREFKSLDEIGTWGLITNPRQSKQSLNSIQKSAKKRGVSDIRNLAETIAKKQNVSYPTAYSFADPIKDHPETNSFIQKLPYNLGPLLGLTQKNTERILPKLADLIKKEKVSPMTAYHYLQEKNYDPLLLKDYLNKHRDKLELTPFQTDQLNKTVPLIPFLNDFWMSIFGGIEYGGIE